MSTASDAEDSMPPRYSDWPLIINLSNSIIGIAVLALPFCFKECGLILGAFLLLGSAWITEVTCHLLVKAAVMTKKRSYEYLALHIFGIVGKFTVEISIIGLLLGTCIAFYIIIGDIGPAIISDLTGLENSNGLRNAVLIMVTLFGVLPFAMLPNIDSLSHFSAASLCFYSCFALHVVLSALPTFFSGTWFDKINYWNPEGLFKCLPIYALSYSCQTQLFIIYEALPDPSVKRMGSITKHAIIMVSCLYILVGGFGYIAFFDREITGDVLMNFQSTVISDLIKLGFVISTTISFPLIIFPCRASIYTLFFAKRPVIKSLECSVTIPYTHFKLITLGIVILTLCVGIAIPNVEFMLAITGATMGSLICYILPAVMSMTMASLGQGKQKLRAQFVLFVGIAVLLASTFMTLSSQEQLAQEDVDVKLPAVMEHHGGNDLDWKPINDRLLHDKPKEPPNAFLHDKRKEPPNPFEFEKVSAEPVKPLAKQQEQQQQHSNDDKLIELPQQQQLDSGKAAENSQPINHDDTAVERRSNSSVDNELRKYNEVMDLKPPVFAEDDRKLAAKLLDALVEQKKEHENIIEEQKKIIADLRQHQEWHENDDGHRHQDANKVESQQNITDVDGAAVRGRKILDVPESTGSPVQRLQLVNSSSNTSVTQLLPVKTESKQRDVRDGPVRDVSTPDAAENVNVGLQRKVDEKTVTSEKKDVKVAAVTERVIELLNKVSGGNVTGRSRSVGNS